MSIRKKRLRKRNFLLIVIFLIITVFLIVNTTNKKNNTKKYYSNEAIEIIKANKIEKVFQDDYSKTLDEILKANRFNDTYLEEYLKITYINQEDFIDKVNKYLDIGYNSNDINNIFKLSINNQNKLLNHIKVNISRFINIKNFDVNNIERYNKYEKNNNYNLKDIVTYVNISLDKPYYTDTSEANNPNSLTVLVNKYNYLPNNYKPDDLVYVAGAYGNEVPFRKVLKEDFIALQQAAKNEISINLMPTTAFRNQNFQTTLYNNYVASDGKEMADTYSARPGYSEHQTGLAIDLKNTALKGDLRLTDENFEWLNNNAYKYGFIIRYPKDKEYITGYQFENWHIRYVGKEIAKTIHDNDLTLEEYIDLYITEY